MIGRKRKIGTVAFSLIYTVLALAIAILSIRERMSRIEGIDQVITGASLSVYLILILCAVSAVVTSIFIYLRGNLNMASSFNCKNCILGVTAALVSVGFVYMAVGLIFKTSSNTDMVLGIAYICSCLFFLKLSYVHFTGGFGGITNLDLIGSIMPIALFFILLLKMFFEVTSLYPIVDNVIIQIGVSVALMFFLGMGKDIWVCGASFGRKLMSVTGFIFFLLTVVCVISPIIAMILMGNMGAAIDIFLSKAEWIPVSIYMVFTSISLLRRSM